MSIDAQKQHICLMHAEATIQNTKQRMKSEIIVQSLFSFVLILIVYVLSLDITGQVFINH